MSENAALILDELCEEYTKGENCNWDSINATRVGLSKEDFILACEELKRKGILPYFNKTKGEKVICFLGIPGSEFLNNLKEISEGKATCE